MLALCRTVPGLFPLPRPAAASPLVPPKVYGKEINVTLTLGELGTQSSVL